MSSLQDRKANIIATPRSLITRRALLLPTLTLLASPRIAKAYLLQRAGTCSSSSYTGPGDVLPLSAFLGVARAYNQAYAAACGNALDLRKSLGGTMTATFLTTGELDAATITTWAAGDTIFVSKAYDQTGNGHHVTQGTNANQPQLFLTGGPNNKPYIEVVNNINGKLTNGSGPNGVSPTSLMCVGNRTAGTEAVIFVGTSGNRIAGGNTTARINNVGSGGGSVIATSNASNGAWHAIQASNTNGGTAVIRSSGTRFTGTGVTYGTTNVDDFCSGRSASTIQMCEGGYILGTQWSSTDETNMAANQTGFYGAI